MDLDSCIVPLNYINYSEEIILGNTDYLEPSVLFEGTQTNPSHIALAFYSGVFSFSGW